jgi:putative acetyltransferase
MGNKFLSMLIRPAIPEDIPALQRLYRDTILSVGARDYNATQVAAWASTAENRDSFTGRLAGQYFYVAVKTSTTPSIAGAAVDVAAVDAARPVQDLAQRLVIGFASLESRTAPGRDGNSASVRTGYFDLLYVHKDYQRRGVALRLLEKILEKARELGLAGIDVEASITARSFFEKHNFRMLEEQTVFVKGVALLNYKMRLELI